MAGWPHKPGLYPQFHIVFYFFLIIAAPQVTYL